MIGLLLAAPLAGFALEAVLGAGAVRFPAEAWGRTLLVGGGASLVALLLGIPTGLALTQSRRPLAFALTLLPLLMPPALGAAAWLGAGLPLPGTAGCAAILGGIYWPVIALLLHASLCRVPAGALEAASLQMSSTRILRTVLWPHARPAILAGAFLVFLLAASESTVPATFTIRTVAMVIYEDLSLFNYASAATAALPLVAVAVVAAAFLRRIPSIPESRAARPALQGAPLVAAGTGAWVAWMLTVVAPAMIFVAGIGSPRNFWNALSIDPASLAWSGAVAGACALLLTAWASFSLRRSRLEPVWLAMLVLPGVVAGFGTLGLASRLGVQAALAPSGILLLLALMSRFAYAAWLPMRDAVDRRQLEAAELAGMSRVRMWRKIVAPAVLPRALAAAAIVFVLALGELGPSVLLTPPGRETIVRHLFGLMHYGYNETVASLALLLFGTAALLTWGALHAGRLRQA